MSKIINAQFISTNNWWIKYAVCVSHLSFYRLISYGAKNLKWRHGLLKFVSQLFIISYPWYKNDGWWWNWSSLDHVDKKNTNDYLLSVALVWTAILKSPSPTILDNARFNIKHGPEVVRLILPMSLWVIWEYGGAMSLTNHKGMSMESGDH